MRLAPPGAGVLVEELATRGKSTSASGKCSGDVAGARVAVRSVLEESWSWKGRWSHWKRRCGTSWLWWDNFSHVRNAWLHSGCMLCYGTPGFWTNFPVFLVDLDSDLEAFLSVLTQKCAQSMPLVMAHACAACTWKS